MHALQLTDDEWENTCPWELEWVQGSGSPGGAMHLGSHSFMQQTFWDSGLLTSEAVLILYYSASCRPVECPLNSEPRIKGNYR